MRLTYDPEYNVAYLHLREGRDQVETIHVSEELKIDMTPDGKVYGIEFLNANEQLRSRDSDVLELINEATGESSRIKLTG